MADAKEQVRRKPGFRLAWGFLLLLALVLAVLFGVSIITGVRPEDFEAITGSDWATFTNSNPEIADYIDTLARLVAAGFLGLVAFVVAILWSRLRSLDIWAFRVLWIFPAVLGLIAAVVFDSDDLGLSLTYVALTLVTAMALLWTRRYIRG